MPDLPNDNHELPDNLLLTCGAGNIAIEAAKDGDGESKLPRFKMTAYTGGQMSVAAWYLPVVIEFDGLKIPTQKTPVRFNHDPNAGVGHTDKVEIVGGKLVAEGVISRDTEQAREVAVSGKRGFPWSASVGIEANQVEHILEDEIVEVNDRKFKGPLYVVRKAALGEISFVDLGADRKAKARVTAKNKEPAMAKKKEVQEAPAVEAEAEAKIEAAGDESTKVKPTPTPVTVDTVADAPEISPAIEASRKEAAEDLRRQAAVRKVCGESHTDIAAQAIEEGWSQDRAELAVLRANRTTGPFIVSRDDSSVNTQVLECALRLGSSEPQKQVEAAYGEEVLDVAHKHRRMSLRGLIAASCAIDGQPCPPISASQQEWVQAAFSTSSVAGILSNTANKMLLSAFAAVPSAARLVAKKLSAKDFKVHTGYRLGGDATLKVIGSGGELKHGTLTESSFTYQINTYGELIGLTRQQWINDDLGAFTQIPQRIGRGAALALENLFWALVLANTNTFFSSGNANYISGADTALGIAGLDLAVQALEEQVDGDGNPILITGKYLVVPPALGGTARRIYTSDALIAVGVGAAAKTAAAANTFKGVYEPLSVPHLKALTKAWYLFGDPADVAAFGIAYLNGVEAPVVEEVQAPPDILGRAWRGYLDFGVCQVEKQGAVKSKGEA